MGVKVTLLFLMVAGFRRGERGGAEVRGECAAGMRPR